MYPGLRLGIVGPLPFILPGVGWSSRRKRDRERWGYRGSIYIIYIYIPTYLLDIKYSPPFRPKIYIYIV